MLPSGGEGGTTLTFLPGDVSTHLGCHGILTTNLRLDSFLVETAQNLLKSVTIWQRVHRNYSLLSSGHGGLRFLFVISSLLDAVIYTHASSMGARRIFPGVGIEGV